MVQRLKPIGERLIVGVSTDEFNCLKGKQSVYPYEERAEIVNAIECVDLVILETYWDQKRRHIVTYEVDILGIGEDWRG